MQKFIITSDGTLKYGNVRMHKDLLTGSETCIGGGFYEFDLVSNRLLLTGRSYDFGRPAWNRISLLKVPSVFKGLTILYENEDIREFLKIDYI